MNNEEKLVCKVVKIFQYSDGNLSAIVRAEGASKNDTVNLYGPISRKPRVGDSITAIGRFDIKNKESGLFLKKTVTKVNFYASEMSSSNLQLKIVLWVGAIFAVCAFGFYVVKQVMALYANNPIVTVTSIGSALVLLWVVNQWLDDENQVEEIQTGSVKTIDDPLSYSGVVYTEEMITEFFNTCDKFEWNFEEKFKYQKIAKEYWRGEYEALMTAADNPGYLRIVKRFQDHAFAGKTKPVLSDYIDMKESNVIQFAA